MEKTFEQHLTEEAGRLWFLVQQLAFTSQQRERRIKELEDRVVELEREFQEKKPLD